MLNVNIECAPIVQDSLFKLLGNRDPSSPWMITPSNSNSIASSNDPMLSPLSFCRGFVNFFTKFLLN